MCMDLKGMFTESADDIISLPGLEKHVEGGFYTPSFQSDAAYDEKRSYWTSIYL